LESFLIDEGEVGEVQTLAVRIIFAQVQGENYSQGITSLINSNKEHAVFKNR
jgi:hypothetical protein